MNAKKAIAILKLADELDFDIDYSQPLQDILVDAENLIVKEYPTIHPVQCDVVKASGGGQWFCYKDNEGETTEQYGEIVNYMAEKRAGKKPGDRIYYHKFVDSDEQVIALWTPMIEI